MTQRPLDIFVLAGQSNMAGRGVISDEEPHPPLPAPGVGLWDAAEKKWGPAAEPLHRDERTVNAVRRSAQGAGLGASFAACMAAATGGSSRVGLVCVAVGSSFLSDWEPGGSHYQEMLRNTKAALEAAVTRYGSARVRALLWHQGEADCSDASLAATYHDRLSAMFAAFRTDLGTPQLPIVCGELGHFVGRRADAPLSALGSWKDRSVAYESVQTAIADAVSRSAPCALASAEGLRDVGDLLHLDAPSLRRFGERYAAALLSLEEGNQPSAEAGCRAEQRVGEDGTPYTKAQFVQYYGGTVEWDSATVVEAPAPSPEKRADRVTGRVGTMADFTAAHGAQAAGRWERALPCPPPLCKAWGPAPPIPP
eukprot:TRINITY_DN7279_c0_g1_i1.p1 TRINITY_DN7279_c0_g1~~TRINITY_DN7279_c0_g1_i1.p1  ORF type:complete len:393 (+),score=81.20 TRINITY_DN7279_c0_g1_i1:81-1181(+)